MRKFFFVIVVIASSIAASSQNTGIGTTTPAQKLDVNGKLKVGDDAQAPLEGTIRWNNTTKDFEGYTGTSWVSLTKAGVSALGTGSAGPVSNYKSIFPSDINEEKQFGFSIDMDTNYAVIGAVKSNSLPTRVGAVYIFNKQTNGNWVQQAKLLPDATDTRGAFGYRVAINGEYVAVTDFITFEDGALNNNASQVYVFKRTGTVWSKQTVLNEVSSTQGTPRGSEYGSALDMDSTHIVIGAPLYNLQAGAAFVYQRTGAVWSAPVSLTHQLTNAGTAMHFGSAVSLYNSEIIVGAPGEGDFSGTVLTTPLGRVYLYRKQTGVWNNIFDIMPGLYGNNPTNTIPLETKFGTHVALYDRYMIVSAPLDNSVFIYVNDGTGEIRFGYSNVKAVNMYNNKATILSGNKVYVHKRTGSNWNLYAYYADPDIGVPESLSMWGNEIIMGIPSFYKCSGSNCFNTGKATIATVE